MVRILVKNKKS